MDNETFQLLIDHLKDVVFQMDEEGCWTYLNPAWEEITGFSIEGAIGSHFQGYVLPDDRKKVTNLFKQIKNQKHPAVQTEVRFITKTGKIIWIDFSLQLIHENIIIGSLRDITVSTETEKRLRTTNKKLIEGLQREQALTEEYQSLNEKLLGNEEELREKIEKISELNYKLSESEELLKHTSKVARVGGWEIDIVTRNIKLTDEAYHLIELPVASSIDLEIAIRLLYPDHQPMLQRAIEQLIRKGKEFDIEVQLVTAKGKHIWVRIIGKREAESNKSAKLYGIFQDITEIKEAEQALRESERRLRTLIANTPAIVYRCVHDAEFTMEFISEEIHNISGYPANDFIHNHERSYNSIIDPHDQQHVKETVDHALQKNQPFQIEYRIRHRDGTPRWMLERGQGVFDEQGKVKFLDGIVLDITEKKNIENAIREHNDQLRKANLELDNFVYRVSHDLRAPLSSSLGLIEVIRNEPDQENVTLYLQLMRNLLQKQDKFIRDILDYSRNSRLDAQITKIDFKKLVEDVLEQLEYIESDKNIKRKVEINQKYDFYSDSYRLKIIFSNLVSNAIRYADPKKPAPFVKVKLTANQRYANIRVEDNGIGIHHQHLDKIFDMFYRATTIKPGSGLGLYIVNEAVSKLNGHIKVESAFGMGSRFIVNIPNRKDPESIGH